MRADRLLQIVSLLRAHGRLTAVDLAHRLEVTPRTIMRDMEALSTAGVPVYAERGRRGGFALLPGYRPAVEQLSAAEVEAVLLAGVGELGRLGRGDDLSRALRKITVAVAPELVRSAERVSERVVIDPTGWYGAADPLPCFAPVQQAVLADRRLRIHYQNKELSPASTRTVDPYGLLQAAGSWYLIAAHRGRPRTYRLSRVQRAEVLEEPSNRPADLDLPAMWRQLREQFSRPPAIPIRLEITDRKPHLVSIMLARTAGGPPRIDPGPPMIMELEVSGLDAAVAGLAGLGAGVRVLHPPELITLLRRRLAETAALYT